MALLIFSWINASWINLSWINNIKFEFGVTLVWKKKVFVSFWMGMENTKSIIVYRSKLFRIALCTKFDTNLFAHYNINKRVFTKITTSHPVKSITYTLFHERVWNILDFNCLKQFQTYLTSIKPNLSCGNNPNQKHKSV